MFIEDEELRTLYRNASQDHIDRLEAGLLHLEKHPDDSAKLKGLLRATHSLKGDSRMLGVQDAETLTHQMENLLSAVEQGERKLTPGLCDCLYQGLDAVRKIAHEAVTGDPANVSVFHVLAQLISADDAPETSPSAAPDSGMGLAAARSTSLGKTELSDQGSVMVESRSNPDFHLPLSQLGVELDAVELNAVELDAILTTDPSAGQVEGTAEAAALESETDDDRDHEVYHIDTVRVESAKLDTLMTQAGELAVTKRRIAHRRDAIDTMLAFWESWTQETSSASRLAFEHLEQALAPDALAALQKFRQLNEGRLEKLGELLKQLHTNAHEDSAQLDTLSNDLEAGILKLRQLPVSSLFSLFPRMVRDLAKQQGKQINLVIEGEDTQADKRILEEMKAPLTHLIRNAIDHGIEPPSERILAGKPPTATLTLKAYQRGTRIGIEVIDDGRGLNLESIQRTAVRRGLCTQTELTQMSAEQIQNLIFVPGFSTRSTITEISGRGVGLDVVRVNVERLKGSIEVRSNPGQGCTFQFTLNTSLATTSALILAVNQTPYAIPLEFVDRMMRVDRHDIFSLEGCPTVTCQGQPLSVALLRDLLDLPTSVAAQPQTLSLSDRPLYCVVLKVGSERLGLFVDDLLDQQDIVLKPHSQLLKRVRNIAGATILGTGEVCMVLSPSDLLKSARGKGPAPKGPSQSIATAPKASPKVLLVEDSLPIRTLVQRILVGAGYRVTAAVDGLDGLDKLQGETFDAVVSDVEMPNLDGLGLTTQIRQHSKYETLPIILVTTLAKDEDQRRGAEAGANAYITKGDFDQSLLINTLRRLV
ncbi:MAG: hybrid sensor histidine kinase/response regulator [Cyanobacteria bacterium P01_A01_bin.114]